MRKEAKTFAGKDVVLRKSEIALNLLAKGEVIVETTGLSKEEVEA